MALLGLCGTALCLQMDPVSSLGHPNPQIIGIVIDVAGRQAGGGCGRCGCGSLLEQAAHLHTDCETNCNTRDQQADAQHDVT